MRLALLAIPAVRSALSLELGRQIEYHATIGSTQDRARELAAVGSSSALVVADEQTAGRGTKGRAWEAPAGTSLLASWLFRPAPADAALFVLVAAVAMARALERLAGLDEWRGRATLLGRTVEVVRDGRPPLRGIARDVAADGALVVGTERVLAGEVRILA